MQKPERFDWHFVTFWGSLGVAVVFLISAGLSKDGQPHTIFDEQGRYELKRFVRYTFPSLADKWGFNENHAIPQQASSRQARIYPR